MIEFTWKQMPDDKLVVASYKSGGEEVRMTLIEHNEEILVSGHGVYNGRKIDIREAPSGHFADEETHRSATNLLDRPDLGHFKNLLFLLAGVR